jgi:hypothetical protein
LSSGRSIELRPPDFFLLDDFAESAASALGTASTVSVT